MFSAELAQTENYFSESPWGKPGKRSHKELNGPSIDI